MTVSLTVSREPLLIVVSGPSGVGKSTIVDKMLTRAANIVASVSVTTRAPRGGERDGFEYFFVTREEFERRRDAGDFLEWAEVHGNLYATPAAFLESRLAEGMNVVLEIDIQGGANVRRRFPGAVLIYLLPPGIETLKSRLEGRATDSEEDIRRRIENAKRELSRFEGYDYLVINDDVERCAEDCLAIVRAEALRRERTALA